MHYYGYKLHEIMGLEARDYYHLLKCMEINTARERLYGMQDISYPHMEKTDRKDIHKSAYQAAFPSYFDDLEEPIKTTQITEFLKKGRRQ
jgi:hypothetical protein